MEQEEEREDYLLALAVLERIERGEEALVTLDELQERLDLELTTR